jgi:O-acetyl-ADP-ribose deacetylase (regulator of RNase III)
MINEIRGDLLSATDGVIAHCVNCQGVMGAGVAKSIKQKWPDVYESYRTLHRGVTQQGWPGPLLGSCQLVRTRSGELVANLFGQNYYGAGGDKYVSYDALDNAFDELAEELLSERVCNVVNFPLIGCGLGGGHWPVVREIIEHRLPDERFIKNLYVL